MSSSNNISSEFNKSPINTGLSPSTSFSKISSFFNIKRSQSSASKIADEKTVRTNPFSKMTAWVMNKVEKNKIEAVKVETIEGREVEWEFRGKKTIIKVSELAIKLGISKPVVMNYADNNKLQELARTPEIEKLKGLERLADTWNLPVLELLEHSENNTLDKYLSDKNITWKINGKSQIICLSKLADELGIPPSEIANYAKRGKLDYLNKLSELAKKHKISASDLLKFATAKGPDSFNELEQLAAKFKLPVAELFNHHKDDIENESTKLDKYLLEAPIRFIWRDEKGKKVTTTIPILAKKLGVDERTVLKYLKNDKLEHLQKYNAQAITLNQPLKEVLPYLETGNLDAYLLTVKAKKIAENDKKWAEEVDKRCEATFANLDSLFEQEKAHPTGLMYQTESGGFEKMKPEDLESIKKTIKCAYLVLGKTPLTEDVVIYDLTKKHRILVRGSNDSIAITGLFGKYIAGGAFGTVFQTVDLSKGELSTGNEAIIKIPKLTMEPSTEKDDIVQEYTLLKKLHGEKEVLGIQKPLKLVRNVLTNEVSYCHLGPRYEQDLKDILPMNENGLNSEGVHETSKLELSESDRITMTYQLLHGVSHLHERNITHGDIKPGNIFCDFNKTQEPVKGIGPRLYLADFGGALDHTTKDSNILQESVTPEFRLKSDNEAAKKAHEAGNKELYLEIEKKADVFATCSVIYSMFTNEQPYTGTPGDGTMELKSGLVDKLKAKGLSEVAADLVVKGLSVNFEDRPNIDEITGAIALIDMQDPEKVAPEHAVLLIPELFLGG